MKTAPHSAMSKLLRQLAISVSAFVCVSCSTTAQRSGGFDSVRNPVAEGQILALEEARLTAFRNADREGFSRLVAGDLIMTHSDGSVGTRASELALMRPPTPDRPLPTLHLEDTQARLYGSAAVLTGSLVERRDQRVALRLRFTHVYAKRDGRWVLVAGQLNRAATP